MTIKRSKEQWFTKAEQEGDSPVTAGVWRSSRTILTDKEMEGQFPTAWTAFWKDTWERKGTANYRKFWIENQCLYVAFITELGLDRLMWWNAIDEKWKNEHEI